MVIVRVQHHKVSFLSHLDTADAVGPVQGGGSIQCEGGYGFFDTYLHIDTCQRKGQRDRTGETTAGVEVGGQCYGTARINHLAPAGIRLFQGKGGKREQCGNHAFIRHGTDVGIGSMQQVVGRDGREFRSQPRTTQRYDFIGVEFQCQSHFTGGGQQAAGLSDREHALLAKDIAKLCQPVLNNGGHDFTDNEIHVIVRASIVFLRHCMRAQKRRNDVHTLVLIIVQTAHHTELQQLGFLVQAVAALALDGGNSHSAHLLQEALCLGAQLDKVALTRSFHRTDNAAATLHNGHIALAFQPPGEFFGTFPAKHEVRFHQSRLVHDFIYQGVLSVLQQQLETPLPLDDEPQPAPRSIPENRVAAGRNHFAEPAAREPVAPRYTPAPASGSRPAAPWPNAQPGYQKQQGEVYRQLLQTPAPMQKLKAPEPQEPALAANSQSFGRVLTIVHSDCALLERDGNISLLSLPVAERWLRQAQLTPGEAPVCAQPLLIPLRLKVSAEEKSALEKAQSALAELGIDFQSDAQHVTIRAVPLPLRQQNLQILIPELIGYLAKQSVFEPGNIAQWIARNLMSEHAQWSMAQAITLLADVERLCPQLVKTPPGGLLQSVDLHPAIKALKDE